jgi:ligand-binding sensor domain-containing protein
VDGRRRARLSGPIPRNQLAQYVPASLVRRIVQDDKGFLWLGAADGLRRHDGYGFMRVPESEDPKSTGFIIAESLMEDRSGRIWFGIDDSLGRYDPATGDFKQYRSHAGSTCGTVALAHQISEDADGLIWLATDDGITALDPVTYKATCYQPRYNDDPAIGEKRVISTLASRDGALWITSGAGLDTFDRRSGKVTRHFQLETSTDSPALTTNTTSRVPAKVPIGIRMNLTSPNS